MNAPLISVVMVICNVDRFLVEAIESVLNQTFHNFEFIILDYGSTDKSQDIVLSYAAKDNRIKLHATPPSTYIEAKIAACSMALGRYIAVQDADDNSLPNRLAWEVEFMEENPAVGVVGGAADWINAEGKFLWMLENPGSDEEIKVALATRSPFVHSSILMRREAYSRVGGYRLLFAQAEDYDLFMRMSEHFQCANLKQVVVQYRIHPQQLSLRTRRKQTIAKLAAQGAAAARQEQHMDPLESVLELSQDLLPKLGISPARLQAELFLEYRNWIRNMCAAGEYSVALKSATEILATEGKDMNRDQTGDLKLTVAQICWKQKRFLRSLVAMCQAVFTKPVLAGDLFGSLLRRVSFI
jgi:glycosyltransferase involved in cell wall biosynthesis